jgi:hypothetical protein
MSTYKNTALAQCYFCAKRVPELPELKNGRKFSRKVVFCNSRCFQSYLAANRPIIKIDQPAALDMARRASARLEELKADVLFGKPDAIPSLVSEEIIYELTFIVSGREEVTKGDRYECLPDMRAPQRPARL